MDLRPFLKNEDELASAKALIAQTHLGYQPFRLAEDIEVGGGYEFLKRKPGAGMVYWPNYEAEKDRFPGYPFKCIDPAIAEEFSQANAAIRALYDGFVDQICARVGNIDLKTVCDIGCFSGYMPVSFALKGARQSVGYDQDDRSACFAFLNRTLGTHAEFIHAGYDLENGRVIGWCPPFDVVISMSVLQHMAEPLRHLRFLRTNTREALFLMTNVWDDDELLMRYGEPNLIFNRPFPWCFDNSVYLTEKLLMLAIEKAGFKRIEPLEFRLPPSTEQAESAGHDDYTITSPGGPLRRLTGRALLCFV